MPIASIGIDLGKTTFHLVALGERSKVLVRKKLSRAQLLAYTANLHSSLIGLDRHEQARQPVPAAHADPRCPSRAFSRQVRQRRNSASGCTGWLSVLRATKSWWQSPTNWHASPGPCYPAARTIDISRYSRRQPNGRGKDAPLGKHRTLSTFPRPRRRSLNQISSRSAEERRRRENSQTACRKTWC